MGPIHHAQHRTLATERRQPIASRGKPKAAVISIEDLRPLEELEDALAAHEALEAYEAGETVPWEEAVSYTHLTLPTILLV